MHVFTKVALVHMLVKICLAICGWPVIRLIWMDRRFLPITIEVVQQNRVKLIWHLISESLIGSLLIDKGLGYHISGIIVNDPPSCCWLSLCWCLQQSFADAPGRNRIPIAIHVCLWCLFAIVNIVVLFCVIISVRFVCFCPLVKALHGYVVRVVVVAHAYIRFKIVVGTTSTLGISSRNVSHSVRQHIRRHI